MSRVPAAVRERVEDFLLTSLRGTGADRYRDAISVLEVDLRARGFELADLSEEEADWLVADVLADRFEASEVSRAGIGLAGLALAALSRTHPRWRLKTCWKALDVWRTAVPPVQAPAAPRAFALAAASWLVLAGQPGVAAVVVACFTGLLRVGEALSLTRDRIFDLGATMVFVLGVTKRGIEQKVTISGAGTVAFLREYLWRHSPADHRNRFADVSYPRVCRWLLKASEALGFPADTRFTPHSLRRGGATQLFINGVEVESIMVLGRWAQLRSCREYLRLGETGLLRASPSVPAATWDRCSLFSQLGVTAFTMA